MAIIGIIGNEMVMVFLSGVIANKRVNKLICSESFLRTVVAGQILSDKDFCFYFSLGALRPNG